MSSDILPFYEKAASKEDYENIDRKYFRSLGMILPKNSGPRADAWDKIFYGKEKFEANE